MRAGSHAWLLRKTAWLGLCLNPTCSDCAGACNPRAYPTTGSPMSCGHCQSHGNHSAWEPGLNHSSNIAKGSEVIHYLKGCICCISLASFIMAASDILSLHSDNPNNLTGRNLDRAVASYSLAMYWPGKLLHVSWARTGWCCCTHCFTCLSDEWLFWICRSFNTLTFKTIFLFLKIYFPCVVSLTIMLAPWDLKCSSS